MRYQVRRLGRPAMRRLGAAARRVNWLSAIGILGIAGYAAFRGAQNDGLHFAEGSVSSQVRDLLWFSVLCGLSAFAAIEAAKRLTNVRAAFHRWRIRTWFGERIGRSPGPWNDDICERAFEQLSEAMGVADRRGKAPIESRRVFNLPSEQLAAQVGAAGDLALSTDESRFWALITGLTGDAVDIDWARLYAEAEFTVLTDSLGRLGSENPLEDLPPKIANIESPGPQDFLDLRRGQQVRIGIDQLQITLSGEWRRYVWGVATFLSGGFGIAFAYAGDDHLADQPRHVIAALLLGGVIAGIARDLSAIAERLRA